MLGRNKHITKSGFQRQKLTSPLKPKSKSLISVYRSEASEGADNRVESLKRITGLPLPCLNSIHRHETRFLTLVALRRRQVASLTPYARWSGVIYGAIVCFVLSSLSLGGEMIWLSLLLATFAGLGIYSFIKCFRDEISGSINRLKQGYPKLSMIIFIGYSLRTNVLYPRDPYLRSFGSLFFTVGLFTLITVAYMKWLRLYSLRSVSIALPSEAVVHGLATCLLLLETSRDFCQSPSKQQRFCIQLERSALALERGMSRRFATGDRRTQKLVKKRMQGSASYLRDLKLWVATPRSDTYPILKGRLIQALECSAYGNWDVLPTSSRSEPRPTVLWNLIAGFIVILFSGISIALIAWLVARLPGHNLTVIGAILAPLIPILGAYLNSTILPALIARRA